MKLVKWLLFVSLSLTITDRFLYLYAADKAEVEVAKDIPVSDKTAAGVMIYSLNPHDHKLYVLLGERRNEWSWGNFGGKSEVKRDKNLIETAIREVDEESAGLIKFKVSDLIRAPFYDLFTPTTGELYRMFIAEYKFIEASNIKKEAQIGTLAYQEYTNFRWIALDDLLRAIKSPEMTKVKNQETFKVGTIKLHPPLARMLLKPGVREELAALLAKLRK